MPNTARGGRSHAPRAAIARPRACQRQRRATVVRAPCRPTPRRRPAGPGGLPRRRAGPATTWPGKPLYVSAVIMHAMHADPQAGPPATGSASLPMITSTALRPTRGAVSFSASTVAPSTVLTASTAEKGKNPRTRERKGDSQWPPSARPRASVPATDAASACRLPHLGFLQRSSPLQPPPVGAEAAGAGAGVGTAETGQMGRAGYVPCVPPLRPTPRTRGRGHREKKRGGKITFATLVQDYIQTGRGPAARPPGYRGRRSPPPPSAPLATEKPTPGSAAAEPVPVPLPLPGKYWRSEPPPWARLYQAKQAREKA